MEKEIKITPPDGYEIDCIKFKPIAQKWRGNVHNSMQGYFISPNSEITEISPCGNNPSNYNVFATEKQAKSALAMARISQIMDNDKRFGGVVTDEEWMEGSVKCVLERYMGKINKWQYRDTYDFLAFHTEEQCDLFLKENEDLVRDYLML